jgi:hypothetical protein
MTLRLVSRLLGVDSFFAQWQAIEDDPALLCGCDDEGPCDDIRRDLDPRDMTPAA